MFSGGKKMRKILFLLLLGGSLVVLTSSCGSQNESSVVGKGGNSNLDEEDFAGLEEDGSSREESESLDEDPRLEKSSTRKRHRRRHSLASQHGRKKTHLASRTSNTPTRGGISTSCDPSDLATYYQCRYQESRPVTNSAPNRQTVTVQHTCTKEGSPPVQLALYEYNYGGPKPSPNALVCEIRQITRNEEVVIGFAHWTANYCRENNDEKYVDSLKEAIREHSKAGYQCSPSPQTSDSPDSPDSSASFFINLGVAFLS